MTCPNCAEIESIERGGHPWAIARLRHGYVSLNPTQYHEGATFYIAKRCVAELHELEPLERQGHLMEMAGVAAAVFRAVGARKMNYEALGNGVPHLHWWLTPRPHDDPRPGGPIWEDLDFLRMLWTKQAIAGDEQAASLRLRILRSLEAEQLDIEVAYR
jgi:diadenosine tetraphosphate (Ap4A) HIT family hydrolase